MSNDHSVFSISQLGHYSYVNKHSLAKTLKTVKYYGYNHGGGYKEPVHYEPAYAPPAPAYSAGSESEGTYVAAPGDARNKRSLSYPEVYYYLA